MRKGRLIGGGVVAAAVIGIAAAVVMAQRQAGAKAPDKAASAVAGAASAPPLEFRPTEVVQPALATMPRTIEFSGPLVAPNTAVVRAKAAGTLLALQVAEGQRVSAGQALGRIDLAELSNRVAERSANLESARATLAQAERTHASNERLAAQSFISPIALENSRASMDTARATLNAAQASLDTLRVGLREAALVAPIAGIVAKRYVLPGEKVAIEQQVLTLVDLAQLELAGSVGTHEVGSLAPGMLVQVRVEGVATPVSGKLARIAPAAEPGTRSIGVTIAMDNPKETLRAGQYALARVELTDAQQRLSLPMPAVGNTSGQDHVWVIDKGALLRRAVTLGRRDEANGRVEVLSGVDAGSQVLAARFDNLREGAKASVVAPKAAAVASAAASIPANLK
ncbi:efflux RND transporter periplasmic adaptor subunit [Aquabacterium sp.]|uniref:efflux RND transporter periplasmic adaptor subunit n=1 Tax=Aquabacterium sp. TaxID=1872578 RepID=UPI002C65A0F9|nr:efflux RND transporter periplasmic adaptor subunit [Aquabacterium sp.]HSW05503.1 efflux RND transporter periplasmic adaptor subunit [Aquabacterium sp.]